MQFDSNLAWKDASAAVGANREVLLALAGVFFLLPGLAFELLFPQPEPAPGLTVEQAMAIAADFYAAAMPYLIPITLLQATGTLAMLALFTDRRRPTVGEAIRLGISGILPYIAAQLVLGIAVGLAGGLLLGIASATGVQALAVIALGLIIVFLAYAAIKTSLAAPVIIVEGVRNPLAALRRSWALTRGNSARLGLFYLLLIIVFAIVTAVVTPLVGVVVALLAGAEAERVVSAVISSGIGAVAVVYGVAVLASVHRQLAGPSASAIGAAFD